jgi:hypothetical protein
MQRGAVKGLITKADIEAIQIVGRMTVPSADPRARGVAMVIH